MTHIYTFTRIHIHTYIAVFIKLHVYILYTDVDLELTNSDTHIHIHTYIKLHVHIRRGGCCKSRTQQKMWYIDQYHVTPPEPSRITSVSWEILAAYIIVNIASR